jgi:hypothetical protein
MHEDVFGNLDLNQALAYVGRVLSGGVANPFGECKSVQLA